MQAAISQHKPLVSVERHLGTTAETVHSCLRCGSTFETKPSLRKL